MNAASRTRRVAGMTLVELLVVLAIIGMLVGLLLPAISMAREASRRSHCKNNLRQLSDGIYSHHETQKHFPTNGWGWRWAGDPDRGFGDAQPGGWIFNILPFIEQQVVRDSARPFGARTKREAIANMLQVPIPLLNCPTRRDADLYDQNTGLRLRNSDMPELVAKTDYAISAGDIGIEGVAEVDSPGPLSTGRRDVRSYRWPPSRLSSGVSYVRSRIRFADVKDGLSNTIMLGEKYIPHTAYTRAYGDDQSMYVGDDGDNRRWTSNPPWHDQRRETVGNENKLKFGSRHSAGCHFAFCDGSVRLISYDIDHDVFRWLGDRDDRKPIPAKAFN